MAGPTEARYTLRKRRRTTQEQGETESGLDRLLSAALPASKILVFSGSGLSATSGMSTFSTKGGLYERAQRKFKLQDGKTLFTYSFYDRNRLEALAFFADIYLEATRATAAPGHHALAELQRAGRLRRHYTLNIDGLAGKVGMDTWHPDSNPDGCTVEMHGNVHHLVCVECGECSPLTAERVKDMRACKSIPCSNCSTEAPPLAHSSLPTATTTTTTPQEEEEKDKEVKDKEEINGEVATEDKNQQKSDPVAPPPLRFKVMLYEDAESEVITPEEVMDLMEEDTKAADLIIWVGISFQQSASTAYFRKVRHWLQEAGRLEQVVQAVVNPSDEALWNLMTASSNQHELNVVEILASSDEVLPLLARHLTTNGITEPSTTATTVIKPEHQSSSTAPPPPPPPPPLLKEEKEEKFKEEEKEVKIVQQESTDAAPKTAGNGAIYTEIALEKVISEDGAGLEDGRNEEAKGGGEEEALTAAATAAVYAANLEDHDHNG